MGEPRSPLPAKSGAEPRSSSAEAALGSIADTYDASLSASLATCSTRGGWRPAERRAARTPPSRTSDGWWPAASVASALPPVPKALSAVPNAPKSSSSSAPAALSAPGPSSFCAVASPPSAPLAAYGSAPAVSPGCGADVGSPTESTVANTSSTAMPCSPEGAVAAPGTPNSKSSLPSAPHAGAANGPAAAAGGAKNAGSGAARAPPLIATRWLGASSAGPLDGTGGRPKSSKSSSSRPGGVGALATLAATSTVGGGVRGAEGRGWLPMALTSNSLNGSSSSSSSYAPSGGAGGAAPVIGEPKSPKSSSSSIVRKGRRPARAVSHARSGGANGHRASASGPLRLSPEREPLLSDRSRWRKRNVVKARGFLGSWGYQPYFFAFTLGKSTGQCGGRGNTSRLRRCRPRLRRRRPRRPSRRSAQSCLA